MINTVAQEYWVATGIYRGLLSSARSWWNKWRIQNVCCWWLWQSIRICCPAQEQVYRKATRWFFLAFGTQRGFQQPQTVLLAPYENGTMQGRSFTPPVPGLVDIWAAFPWMQPAGLASPSFLGHSGHKNKPS